MGKRLGVQYVLAWMPWNSTSPWVEALKEALKVDFSGLHNAGPADVLPMSAPPNSDHLAAVSVLRDKSKPWEGVGKLSDFPGFPFGYQQEPTTQLGSPGPTMQGHDS